MDADDLWLNGVRGALRGGSTLWTFTFAPGNFHEATLSWNPTTASWTWRGHPTRWMPPPLYRYRIVDDMPPALTTILPPGSTVRGLDQVRLFQ